MFWCGNLERETMPFALLLKKTISRISVAPEPDWPRIKNTVEPRLNEVPMDWGNLFVISRVRYIKHLDLTNFRKNNQNVRCIEVYMQ